MEEIVSRIGTVACVQALWTTCAFCVFPICAGFCQLRTSLPDDTQHVRLRGKNSAIDGAIAQSDNPRLQLPLNMTIDWEVLTAGRIEPVASAPLPMVGGGELVAALKDWDRFVAAHVILTERYRPAQGYCCRRTDDGYHVKYFGLVVHLSWNREESVWTKEIDYPNAEDQMHTLTEMWQEVLSRPDSNIRDKGILWPKNNLLNEDQRALAQMRIDALFRRASESGIGWRSVGIGSPYPRLPEMAYEIFDENPQLVARRLYRALESEDTFLLAHILLTDFVRDTNNYCVVGRTDGFDLWYNGLSVDIIIDRDTREWTVAYKRLTSERHEIALYWRRVLEDVISVE